MLSEESQFALAAARVIPGSVIYIYCDFIHPPKSKYIVVLHTDINYDLILGFFINSEVNPIVQSNPDTLACQIPISRFPHYQFLQHDSFINCSEVQDGLGFAQVVNHLVASPGAYMGILQNKEIEEIVQVVQTTILIPNHDKDLIMESFS